MSTTSVYDEETFEGETAHPGWLKAAGLALILFSIITVALGVADTMMAALAGEPTFSALYLPINFAFVGAGIWTPLATFITGIFSVMAGQLVDGSKLKLSISSFLSCFVFMPILIAISILEIKQLLAIAGYDPIKLPMRYSVVVTILVFASLMFILSAFVMVVVCFCTFVPEEERAGLVSGSIAGSKTACTRCAPIINHQAHAHAHAHAASSSSSSIPTNPTAETHYKIMQLIPSNYAGVANPPKVVTTNMPQSYQNAGLKVYGK